LVAGSIVEAAPPDEKAPLQKPPEPRDGSAENSYWGTVTEVTKTSISIQFDNQKDVMPKSFPLSETLAAGKFPVERRVMPGVRTRRWLTPANMYRITDVTVGDWVAIHYARLDGVDICDTISIRRRPGGRVPPLPKGVENLEPPVPLIEGEVYLSMIPYHERMNAYWDLEEKGIAYPEKFGRYRRFPAAPMPRAVGGAGPQIS
jgi:hypothetical protein